MNYFDNVQNNYKKIYKAMLNKGFKTLRKSKYGIYFYKEYGNANDDPYRLGTEFISYDDIRNNEYVNKFIECIN